MVDISIFSINCPLKVEIGYFSDSKYFSLKWFCINDDGNEKDLIGILKKKWPVVKSTTPPNSLDIALISSMGADEKKEVFDSFTKSCCEKDIVDRKRNKNNIIIN